MLAVLTVLIHLLVSGSGLNRLNLSLDLTDPQTCG